jgi:hypothetical protein
MAAGRPLREDHIGMTTGRAGIAPYAKRIRKNQGRARTNDLMKRCHAWIHVGANIGAPRQQNQVHASESSLEKWLASAPPFL